MRLRRAIVSFTTLGSVLFGGLALAAPPTPPAPATAPATRTKPLKVVKHDKATTLKPVIKPHIVAHHVTPVKKADAVPAAPQPKGN